MKKSWNKNPNDMTAAMMIALLQQGSGNLEAAQKEYKYILDKIMKNLLAAYNLGMGPCRERKEKRSG